VQLRDGRQCGKPSRRHAAAEEQFRQRKPMSWQKFRKLAQRVLPPDRVERIVADRARGSRISAIRAFF